MIVEIKGNNYHINIIVYDAEKSNTKVEKKLKKVKIKSYSVEKPYKTRN